MRRTNVITSAILVLLASFTLVSCSSGPSEEELAQLEALKAEVASLQKQVDQKKAEKSDLEKQIAEKQAQLDAAQKNLDAAKGRLQSQQ